MVLTVLAKILRLLSRLSPEQRDEVMRSLQATLYPATEATTETGNAARCRRKRELRKASPDLVADPPTRVAGGSPDGSRPGSPDPPTRVAGGSHAVVASPVVNPVVLEVQEPATTGNTRTSGAVQKAPRVEREGAAIAKLAEKAIAIVNAKPRAEVQQAIDAFHTIFVERNRQKPHITGKDAGLARQLITRHGLQQVLDVMLAMFDSLDPFIAQAGPSFGLLSSQWNKLVQAPRPHISERTRGNLNAVKAFLDASR